LEDFLEPIIVARNLSKQYHPPKGPVAIKDLNLDIQEGEIFSLLGPNGAGKTTLISVVCGLFPPTAGDAMVAGHSVVQNPIAVKQMVGVVPEEIALYSRLTGKQNLRYFGSLYGLGGKDLDRAINGVLVVVGLTERAGDQVARYSNGMKRRLNVAVGILHKPRILLMDEPTLGLDPGSRRQILNLVVHLQREYGVTILYTTHNMDEAQELSDRVGIINFGQIVTCGTPDELISTIQGEDTLRLHIDVTALAPDILNVLHQVKGVKHISTDKDEIALSLLSAAEVLPDILRIMKRSGIEIRTITIQRPNLEAVFLRLTGQRLSEIS
jgi:ABC-2 type transport system ATP-binding protein